MIAICVGPLAGAPKRPVAEATFQIARGIVGDGHDWPHEVVLGAEESPDEDVNLVTRDLHLGLATVGSTLRLGDSVLLEVTGRTATQPHGVFARVIAGGRARPGDRIEFETVIV